jgi:hypothetical protein
MIDKNLPPSEYASKITPRAIPHVTLFPGSQTPRESAFLSQKNLDLKQTQLSNIAKGGKRNKYKRKGGGDTVVIPSLNVDYPNAGDIHQTHQRVVQSLMQNQANAQMDSNVRKVGGRSKKYRKNRKTKRGGTVWGCYSGGNDKKRKSRKSRKSRKGRK